MMREKSRRRAQIEIPLTDQDKDALDSIFEKVEVEEMQQIEVTVARYSVVPLEPWEEIGWVINSSLPLH